MYTHGLGIIFLFYLIIYLVRHKPKKSNHQTSAGEEEVSASSTNISVVMSLDTGPMSDVSSVIVVPGGEDINSPDVNGNDNEEVEEGSSTKPTNEFTYAREGASLFLRLGGVGK